MANQTWTRGFRITWPDGYDGLHGAQFPSGRVVVDDTTSGLIEAAVSMDALNILAGRPAARVEWAPELSPEVAAVVEAAREWCRGHRDKVSGGAFLGACSDLRAAIDALEATP